MERDGSDSPANETKKESAEDVHGVYLFINPSPYIYILRDKTSTINGCIKMFLSNIDILITLISISMKISNGVVMFPK